MIHAASGFRSPESKERQIKPENMEGTPKRKVLIVGGSRGLGLALAGNFGSNGWETTVLSRTAPHITDIKAEIILADATTKAAAKRYLREIEPNLLVINFAQGIYKHPELLEDSEVELIIETNAASVIGWVTAAIQLLPAESKIGWVNSLTALIPDENWALYAAAKASVNHFIECVRPAAARRGIGITVCYPGCLQTDFHRAAGLPAGLPTESVSPNSIVQLMREAIEDGQEFWAAQMDASIVEQYYEERRRFLLKTNGGLK
ncbi:MAG TPA: SDR family oxidoreductase [Pyrinomonadaceae bacterium]|jgi:short-subunit dehydrogenase